MSLCAVLRSDKQYFGSNITEVDLLQISHDVKINYRPFSLTSCPRAYTFFGNWSTRVSMDLGQFIHCGLVLKP